MASKSRPRGEQSRGQEPSHTRADGTANATDPAGQTSDPDTTPQLDEFVEAWTAWSEKHGLELPTHTGIEWSGCCPAHDDSEPSLTANVGTQGKHGNAPKALVVSCFSGCTAQDVVTALGLSTSLLAAERDDTSSTPATKRSTWPDPSALPTAEELQHCHSRLMKHSERLAYLTSERGLTEDVIRDHWIGWNGRAYTLPVNADEWGNLVNVRSYVPDQGMRNRRGCGSPPRLYPEPPTPGHRHVVVTEGEWDALAARSHGIEAYSGTGGAHKWPPGAAEHFAGMTVYVVYDCDESGRSGALKVARDLHPHAHAVRIVDLGLDDREDLTDWFVKYGRSATDLWSLLRDADQYEPQGEEKGALESDDGRDALLAEVNQALQKTAARDGEWGHYHEMLTETDVKALPAPEWLVGGWVAARGVSVVWGAPGIGKTLLLLHLAECVRRGSRWYGESVSRGAVLFYAAEGLHEFRPRLDAQRQHWPLKDTQPAEARFLPHGVDLTRAENVAAVVEAGRRLGAVAGEKVALVVVDPLIENMVGDENAEGMELTSRGLRVIAELLDCAVLVGHHPNASGLRARGNDKLRARVHAMFKMERAGPDEVGLIAEKQRNGAYLARRLLLTPVGESVVLEALGPAMPAHEYEAEVEQRKQQASERRRGEKQAAKDTEAVEAITAALRSEPGLGVGAIKKLLTGTGVGGDRVQRVVRELVDAGEVVQVGSGNKKANYLPDDAPGGQE